MKVKEIELQSAILFWDSTSCFPSWLLYEK